MIRKLLKPFLSGQFLKFLFVGATAAAANWLSRYAFALFVGFSASVILAYALGMTVAFVLNAVFVFPESRRARHLQARDFFAINIAFMPLVWAASVGLNRMFLHAGLETHYSEPLAHGLALAAPMVLTFLFYKFVAFSTAADIKNEPADKTV